MSPRRPRAPRRALARVLVCLGLLGVAGGCELWHPHQSWSTTTDYCARPSGHPCPPPSP